MKVINKERDQYESKDPLIFQKGGSVESSVFFTDYTNLDTRPATGTPTTKKESQNEKKTDSILSNPAVMKLVGLGITSDVQASAGKLVALQLLYDLLDGVDKSSQQGMTLLTEMSRELGNVSGMLRNAKMFEDAQKVVTQNEAMSELAVTNSGFIVLLPNGKIATISPEQYLELSDEEKQKISALTNAQLINKREYKMLHDVLSFELLNSSTGFNNIKKQVESIIDNITTSKTAETYDMYTSPDNNMRLGLKELKALSNETVDNILVTLETESNESSAQLAVNAMWSAIGDNGRTFLKLRAALSGTPLEDLESVGKAYLVQLVGGKVKRAQDNTTRKVTSDLLPASERFGSGNGEGGSKEPISYYGLLANDKLPREITSFIPNGEGYALQIPVGTYGALKDKNGNPHVNIPLGNITEINGIVNKDAGSFGGKDLLSNTVQQEIAYNGDPVFRLTMPYKQHPTKPGEIVPDFELATRFALLQLAESKLPKPLTTVGEKQAFYSQYDLELNTLGEPKNIRDFVVTKVYVGENLYDTLDETTKRYLTAQDNVGSKNIMERTFNKSSNEKSKDIYDGEDVYTGLIYYPVRENAGILGGELVDGQIKKGELNNRTAPVYQGIDLLNKR